MSLTITQENITPEIAQEYLGCMIEVNREPRKNKIKEFVQLMKNGKFFENGDPIRFNVEGQFFDGQHRLLALIESGVSLPFVVIRGVSIEAMLTVDIGAKRSFADRCKIKSKNINITPKITTIITKMAFGTISGIKLKEDEVERIYNKYQESINYALSGMTKYRNGGVLANIAKAHILIGADLDGEWRKKSGFQKCNMSILDRIKIALISEPDNEKDCDMQPIYKFKEQCNESMIDASGGKSEKPYYSYFQTAMTATFTPEPLSNYVRNYNFIEKLPVSWS